MTQYIDQKAERDTGTGVFFALLKSQPTVNSVWCSKHCSWELGDFMSHMRIVMS